MAACSMVHKAAGLQAHPRLTVTRTAEHTAPILCRHCEDAHCARVCPVNAITHDGDAIVLNETLCIGCKLCAIACPFGAITPAGTPCTGVVPVSHAYLAPATQGLPGEAATDSQSTLDPLLAWAPGVRSVAVKCDMCDFRSTGPECVRVCPTGAMHVVDNGALDADADAKRKMATAALGEQVSLDASREQK
jgi:hydrogenase-4 component A